jgi:Tfp pilus assembly protein PilX
VSERLRREDGVALVVALGLTVFLSLLVFGMTSYVTSNQHNATTSSADALARSYAEAALNTAYSRIQYANTQASISSGVSPSSPTLLGCAAGTNGASDCGSPSPLCLSFTGTCPTGTYTTTNGTATVYGLFSGTNVATFAGVSAPASTWVLVATGYARNASGKIQTETLRGTVTISAANAGAVASVWNHVFLTKTLVAGVCQNTFTMNNTVLDVPIYAVGNLCFGGNNIYLKEVTGGQAVDLQVGGRLVFGGTNNTVGDWTTSPATGITSGVVVGNCSTTITGATSDCATNFQYKVGSVSTFISQSDPELTDADLKENYSTFDPGPLHTCATGTTPSPLAANQLDYSIASGEGTTVLPGNSGSGGSGTAFNLTPSSSYACVSTSGVGTGYLIWNNSTSSITYPGVGTIAGKQLAIGGSIYIDAPLNVTQTMTYKGTAVIMVSGTITFATNNMTVCAQNTSCLYTNWQGNTSNTDMLTLATALKNSNSIVIAGNATTFMGSLWMSPTSTLSITANTPVLIGPMALGAINSGGNSFTMRPLPVIKNMPLGAPVPPNVSASISPLTVIG